METIAVNDNFQNVTESAYFAFSSQNIDILYGDSWFNLATYFKLTGAMNIDDDSTPAPDVSLETATAGLSPQPLEQEAMVKLTTGIYVHCI